jgi:hypothetical protein
VAIVTVRKVSAFERECCGDIASLAALLRHRLKQARTNNGNRRKAISGALNKFGRGNAADLSQRKAEEGVIAGRGLRK